MQVKNYPLHAWVFDTTAGKTSHYLTSRVTPSQKDIQQKRSYNAQNYTNVHIRIFMQPTFLNVIMSETLAKKPVLDGGFFCGILHRCLRCGLWFLSTLMWR